MFTEVFFFSFEEFKRLGLEVGVGRQRRAQIERKKQRNRR